MNRALFRVLALVLPLAGLAGLWGWTHQRALQGVEWDVPVQGYDPRDLLRGHYITYRYDWPGLSPDLNPDQQAFMCIDGAPPKIARTYWTWTGNDPVFGSLDTPPNAACPQPVRADPVEGAPGWGLGGGVLYVPQDKAAVLEEKLRDPRLQGVVRIRVREDGRITPLGITFRPRPAEPPAAE